MIPMVRSPRWGVEALGVGGEDWGWGVRILGWGVRDKDSVMGAENSGLGGDWGRGHKGVGSGLEGEGGDSGGGGGGGDH